MQISVTMAEYFAVIPHYQVTTMGARSTRDMKPRKVRGQDQNRKG